VTAPGPGVARRPKSLTGEEKPNLTRVGQMGATYNRFHVTAVCSPTRAALLIKTQPGRLRRVVLAETQWRCSRALRPPTMTEIALVIQMISVANT
jgi:arylsulfatase A-like enzyme